MNVNNEMPKVHESVLRVLLYATLLILGFVVGHSVKFNESVGSPDYEKSEIAKEITKRLIDYDINKTDGSQKSVDSVRSEYKGKRYIAKSISSVINMDDGRKIIYSCTENNELLTLDIIENGEQIILKR